MMNLTCAILHADQQVSEQLEVFIAKNTLSFFVWEVQ